MVRKGLAWFILATSIGFAIWAGTTPEDEDIPDLALALFVLISFAVIALCVMVLVDRRPNDD